MTMMTLTNNAFALDRATREREFGHCSPASMICRDGHHRGTLFTWLPDMEKWAAVDLEGRKFLGFHDRLAVVTLASDDEFAADNGLNQAALGCDFDCAHGEWIIDLEDRPRLEELYGDSLEVLWEQAE